MGTTNYSWIQSSVGCSGSSLTRPLTLIDVQQDDAWVHQSVILVTGNTERAAINCSMAKIMALHYNKLLFRWKKKVCEKDLERFGNTASLLYRESERPRLFGYFFKGAMGQLLDNGNGNVEWGVVNGSYCRYDSLAWNDPTKTAQVLALTEKAVLAKDKVVELPFLPEFINVVLLDRDGNDVDGTSWPTNANINRCDDSLSQVIVPMGIVANGDSHFVKLKSEFGEAIKITFEQHAADLAYTVTIWKAQGATYDRFILLLEETKDAPVWKFEHLYVALSRVRAAEHLRCIQVSKTSNIQDFGVAVRLFRMYSGKWILMTRGVGMRILHHFQATIINESEVIQRTKWHRKSHEASKLSVVTIK